MCRVLSYLGQPIAVTELLYAPDNSFIKQSYDPKMMPQSLMLNLAGFGMVAWDSSSYQPTLPFHYKTAGLPFYDENLQNLANKMKPHCLLSHVRGVPYDNEKEIVTQQNVHPFMFRNTHLALAHNGSLSNFEEITLDLLNYIHPVYRKEIKGTTDSEYIYALFLSQLAHTNDYNVNDIVDAFTHTFEIIQSIRYKHGINTTSPANLFITNGELLAATRFVFDYGWQLSDHQALAHLTYHSLWYTYGEYYGQFGDEYRMKDSNKRLCIIMASEPLTQDTTTWIEVPEYTLLIAWREQGEIKILSHDLNL